MRRHDMRGSAFGAGAGSSGEFGSEGAQLTQELTNGLQRIYLLGCEYPGGWLSGTLGWLLRASVPGPVGKHSSRRVSSIEDCPPGGVSLRLQSREDGPWGLSAPVLMV